MNISRVSDIKIIRSSKKIETIEKKLKEFFENGWLFVKEAFKEMIRFVELLFIFEAKFKCGRIIYWLFDKWVGFRQFLVKESFEGSFNGLPNFVVIYWMIGVSKIYSYFRLKNYVHFVL